MPQPSRGCAACRARKVKCDQGVPACQRCLKAGRVCSGYRAKSELIFRDMNTVSEVKVQARVISKTRERGSYDTPPPSKLSVTQRNYDITGAISSPMTTNLEDVAIPRFLADYVVDAGAVEGNLRFIQDFSRNLHGAFGEALKAVATLSLGRQLKLEWLNHKANQHLCQALPLAAQLLGNSVQAREDSTLATIYLFGLYSMIIGDDLPSRSYPDPYHHNGRVSLLSLRGKEQFRTSIGIDLFYLNYTHLTVKSIILHEHLPPDVIEWVKHSIPKEPHQALPKYNLQAARICAKAQDLFDAPTKDESWILSLLQLIKEIILLDSEYQEWTFSLSGIWVPKYLRNSHTKPVHLKQHVYHHLYAAFKWNNYRACRIHLLEVLLHCIDLVLSHPSGTSLSFSLSETQESSKIAIRDLIADVCASMDFCLGNIDSNGNEGVGRPLGGYLSCWPLYIAMISAERGSETEKCLRGKLVGIADRGGIEIARRLAVREREFPWDLR